MKSPLVAAAAAAALFAMADPAEAFHFSPVATGFTASGTIGLAQGSVGYTCTMTAKGRTGKKGRAKINSVRLSGTDAHCSGTSATGLPWRVKATGPGGGTMSNVGFTGAVGTCGPSATGIQVSGSGAWSFDDLLAPSCIFSGSLNTSPPITIVP